MYTRRVDNDASRAIKSREAHFPPRLFPPPLDRLVGNFITIICHRWRGFYCVDNSASPRFFLLPVEKTFPESTDDDKVAPFKHLFLESNTFEYESEVLRARLISTILYISLHRNKQQQQIGAQVSSTENLMIIHFSGLLRFLCCVDFRGDARLQLISPLFSCHYQHVFPRALRPHHEAYCISQCSDATSHSLSPINC